MKAIFLPIVMLAAIATAQPQWQPHVLWDRSGAGDSSRFGMTSALGDQNQDGYTDFAVWALGWGDPGQASEAMVEFFHGGNPPDIIPYMTYRGHADTDHQFYRFQTVGDLNGDGFVDWQIWRVPQSDPNQITFETYWGGPNADTIPDLVFHGPWTSDLWLFPAGDFNGDGFDDLYLYRWAGDYGQFNYGGNPMDTLPDWTRHSPPTRPFEAYPFGFGDFNADGFTDFCASSPSGFTAFFYGGPNPDTIPRYYWDSIDAYPASVIRSLNADGRADLVRSYSNAHMAVHFGADTMTEVQDYVLHFIGNCAATRYLSSGDINGDGYGDLVTIDDGCNNLWGTLTVHLGHPWLNTEPAIIIQGRTAPLNLVGINDAAALGDVNGDGIDDWSITAFNGDFDGFRGRAVVLAGDTSLRVATDPHGPELPNEFQVTVYPNPFNASTTIALALPAYSRRANLTVYNLLGEKVFVTELAVSGGTAVYRYDAGNLVSGLYLLQVQSGDFKTTTKLMLLR